MSTPIPWTPSQRTAAGREIERQALNLALARKGVRLLATRFRCRGGEVDLVLECTQGEGGKELVFVEVRGRSTWPTALESVDWAKRRKIARAARVFLAGYRGPAKSVRMDVMAWEQGKWTWIEDAWRES
ncbi:MAG: YraN family protein [Bdellovibrionales bacterium]|nr:YraN family protein [Bdellovibrionales bacterium]